MFGLALSVASTVMLLKALESRGIVDSANARIATSMVEISRTLNPAIEIVVRIHNVEEAELLEKECAGTVFVGESELANAMVRHVLRLVEAGPGGA